MPNSFQASVSALKKIAPLLWLRFSLGYAELSGTHSSGLLHLYIALQASMQVVTFEDIVLAIPRSFPIKALYFLFVAGFLASSSRGSCSNCSSPLQLLVSASRLRIMLCCGNAGGHRAGTGSIFCPVPVIHKNNSGGMNLSVPVLVRVLFAYTHDGGVIKAADELKVSAKAPIFKNSPYGDICVDVFDFMPVGGDGVVVEDRCRSHPATLLRGGGTLVCFSNRSPYFYCRFPWLPLAR
jgi:hypothetical protein